MPLPEHRLRGAGNGGGFVSALTPDEQTQLLEMHVLQAMSYRQVSELWNRRNADAPEKHLSASGVHRIVKRMLEAAAEEQKAIADVHRQRHRMMLDQLTRIALSIAIGSKCPVCNGEKVVPKDKLDRDLGVQECPKCEGSGRAENESTRLQAVSTVKGLLERDAKLFGLDAPVEVDQTHRVRVAIDVGGLSGDALTKELEDMFASPELPVVDVEPAPAIRPHDLKALAKRTTEPPASAPPSPS